MAEHYGYRTLDPPVTHRRRVEFHGKQRLIEITDEIDSVGRPPVRLAFHLGPAVEASLDGCILRLRWQDRHGGEAMATMTLPSSLSWSLVRGAEDPVAGLVLSGVRAEGPGHRRDRRGVRGHGLAAADAPRLLNLAWSRYPQGVSLKAR